MFPGQKLLSHTTKHLKNCSFKVLTCYFTAVTTNTHPQRDVFFSSNLCFGGHQSTVTMVFHALAQRRFFLRFSSIRKNMSAFQLVLQYFATGSDTASCQDYKEYEFVDFFSDETQIIDIFTHCKLQPHKLSQYTFATRLTSCQFRILYDYMKKYKQ